MPIKWSAIDVSKAVDEVEDQLKMAYPFLYEAKNKLEQAEKLPRLPQYLTQRMGRLRWQVKGFKDSCDSGILGIRDSIPKQELERQRNLPQTPSLFGE